MNKLLLIVTVILFLGGSGLIASQADEFKIDQQRVQEEFADLNLLEQTVEQNNFMSLSEMQSENILDSKFSNLNLSNGIMMDPALGIPGFWWGCVLGPVGVALAYIFSDNDKEEAKKALIGMLVGWGAGCITYFVFYIWILGNAAWYY